MNDFLANKMEMNFLKSGRETFCSRFPQNNLSLLSCSLGLDSEEILSQPFGEGVPFPHLQFTPVPSMPLLLVPPILGQTEDSGSYAYQNILDWDAWVV